ncbi:hypothetical protein I3843_Q041100 [Carya illinoinensis]|nr:hypothetical protein I3843_Q041100 [Carya illinoinensis]
MQHHNLHRNESPLTPGSPTTPCCDATIAAERKRLKKRGSYNCGRCGLPKKGHSCHPYSHLRRALSFDDDVRGGFQEPETEEDEEDLDLGHRFPDPESDGFPAGCLWEILKRLPPAGLLGAARVCKGWRETARRLWRAAEELRLRVPARSQVGSVLQKCPGLVRLSLRMESDELGRFVADKRCLKSLKMEGCSNLGGFVLCSSSLSTLWLSDLFSLSKTVILFPFLLQLKVFLSLLYLSYFFCITDLITMVDGVGRNCPRLQNIHIASVRLSHSVVLALTAAELRSSISDSGIGMICNVFPETLSRLLLALCPNVTSSGIQFATAQLPLLELMDCGMTICDPNSENSKLIIKHNRLKKLSLWGCSGLDALYLNCPELNDLNLNSCKNLHAERLLLQCPNLESVHASGCQELLIGAIESQVKNNFSAMENVLPSCKRLADGSKRVRVLIFSSYEDDKKPRFERRHCNVLVS